MLRRSLHPARRPEGVTESDQAQHQQGGNPGDNRGNQKVGRQQSGRPPWVRLDAGMQAACSDCNNLRVLCDRSLADVISIRTKKPGFFRKPGFWNQGIRLTLRVEEFESW
jgi:hypothetical protein